MQRSKKSYRHSSWQVSYLSTIESHIRQLICAASMCRRLVRKSCQTALLASESSGWYFSARWILLIIVSSNDCTRFVMRNSTPSNCSNSRRNTETRALICELSER